ncbi:hypothetical protein EBU71_04590 [bacterium]|nr:hypothetical protein [Candidatus Elulimicrobium humile]
MKSINEKKYFQSDFGFDTFYEKGMNDQVEVNRAELLTTCNKLRNGIMDSDTKELLKKIEGDKQRRNIKYSVQEIVNNILNDEVYQGRYMKDPKRQNGKELGNEYLQELYINDKISLLSCQFQRLPNNGDDSYRIIDGRVKKGVSKDSQTTKSLDGIITTGDKSLSIFTINKITHSLVEDVNDTGGAQGNQFELSLSDSKKINFENSPNTYIIYIYDGKFYKNNSHLMDAIDRNDNNNVYHTTSDGVYEVIQEILGKKRV